MVREDFSLTNFNGFCRDSRNSVGKRRKSVGKDQILSGNQSIHCETAIDSPVVQLIIPLPGPKEQQCCPSARSQCFNSNPFLSFLLQALGSYFLANRSICVRIARMFGKLVQTKVTELLGESPYVGVSGPGRSERGLAKTIPESIKSEPI